MNWDDVAYEAWNESPWVDLECSEIEFRHGAEWALAGMAVCAFLEDLAWLATRCRECNGQGYIMGDICPDCCSTGKRGAP